MSADIRPSIPVTNATQAVVDARNISASRPLARGETDQMIQPEAVKAGSEARDATRTDEDRDSSAQRNLDAEKKPERDEDREKNRRRGGPALVVKIDSDTMRAYLEMLDPATGRPIAYLPSTYRQRDPEKREKDIIISGDASLDIKA